MPPAALPWSADRHGVTPAPYDERCERIAAAEIAGEQRRDRRAAKDGEQRGGAGGLERQPERLEHDGLMHHVRDGADRQAHEQRGERQACEGAEESGKRYGRRA